MLNEETPKVSGGLKPKGIQFQKSTSTRKTVFKAPTTRLEDKVFNFGIQKHASDLVKNFEKNSNYIAVNYKHGGPEMSMAIKNMDKPTINVPEVPEDTYSRLDIFLWEKQYK